MNDGKGLCLYKKLSNHVGGCAELLTPIQDNTFHGQFETVRNSIMDNSLYNTITMAEYLRQDPDGHLNSYRARDHVDLRLKSSQVRSAGLSTGNSGNIVDDHLIQPSADVLDFLELRRHFNTWLQISRLRNENRHPNLQQYIGSVLEEFEVGYRDLEDKLAEKLFPLSGVRYQTAQR